MKILAFIDPEPWQEEAAYEITAILVDYCMDVGVNLALVCDQGTALEAGLAAMGSYDPRTVEGAERRISRIRIAGLIEREDELESVYSEPRFSGDQDPLTQLRELGALQESDPPTSRVDELAAIVVREAQEADTVIGIGSWNALWAAAINGAGEGEKVIVLPGLGPEDTGEPLLRLEKRHASVKREEGETDPHPNLGESLATSRAFGEATAALLEFLSGPRLRPEPSRAPGM